MIGDQTQVLGGVMMTSMALHYWLYETSSHENRISTAGYSSHISQKSCREVNKVEISCMLQLYRHKLFHASRSFSDLLNHRSLCNVTPTMQLPSRLKLIYTIQQIRSSCHPPNFSFSNKDPMVYFLETRHQFLSSSKSFRHLKQQMRANVLELIFFLFLN